MQDNSDFIAPELQEKKSKIDFRKVDIWALGVSFYYFITGEFPWKESSEEIVSPKKLIDFSLIEDENARDVLSRMLDRNPNRRPNLRWIFKHPWISSN